MECGLCLGVACTSGGLLEKRLRDWTVQEARCSGKGEYCTQVKAGP